MWAEYEFKTNRTFDNIFFEDKKTILNKIDFFINNKKWYDDKGIPYTLGIGLQGLPGTGKTSFIKSLANKTHRDIIIIPLKSIKTTRQLINIFYEDTYNSLNKKGSKNFNKKIIIFEDIDCIGDVVLNRETIHENKQDYNQEIMNKYMKHSNTLTPSTSNMIDPRLLYDEPITLDDFLNIWDGIRETSGRIIIITSNHYDKLDPALVRPGRIDITLEFKLVAYTILQEIHMHLFDKTIRNKDIKKINNYFYTPAEIINIYLLSNYSEKTYLDRLKLNKKV